MILPMLGSDETRTGPLLAWERLYWKGVPLPFGHVRLRFLLTARERGYDYPGKIERDVFGEVEREREEAA